MYSAPSVRVSTAPTTASLSSLADVGAETDKVGAAGSGVRWPEVSMPPAREGEAEIVPGETAEESAHLLVEKLMAEKVI